MPPIVLTVLKILFLALLYFFVYRALRSVVVDLRGARAPRTPSARPAAVPSGGRKQRPPRSLTVTDERGARMGTYPLDGTMQIGRAEACQVKLSDTYVSQFHARIFQRDEGWFIEDLGSTNGTYLNERRLTGAAPLSAGDRVKVGKMVLEMRR